ncbi:MAG: GNAT family N-acetyltransferase [Alphaproteobacteria bacterium]|nr:GNAT family N-acetyltransferase [Alphaproteobacteria bacterium]MDE2336525.1 GNAT family N-acetyltransferase [Alphaproteobacteria bacterium]
MQKEFNRKSSERLRITTLSGHDAHTVEADNPRSLALLARAYKEVYEAAFPIDAEREPLESWLDSLRDADPSTKVVIVIAGADLDSENPTLKAISVADYYKQTDAGLLAYNAVAPKFQGHGLGRMMVEARKAALLDLAKSCGKPLGGVFIECNDPAKITPREDVMDPAVRIKMFERWGAIVLPIDYVQPPLEDGGSKCDTLKLLAYPHPGTGKYPTKDEIKDYLTGIYTELEKYAGCPPTENPDYIKSVAQLEKLDLDGFYKTASAERQHRQKPPQPPKP